MAKGDTKTNQYLDIAANGTRADLPTDTCCETRSQTLIREVAERIIDLEEEVQELEDNPDVADIVDTYADLMAYDTSRLTDRDIIRVLNDETHGGESTYYRYSKATDSWTYIGSTGQRAKQSDWDEDDSTDMAFIKNKPFYSESVDSDFEQEPTTTSGSTPDTNYVWFIEQFQDYALHEVLADFNDGDTIYAAITYSVNGVERSDIGKFTLTFDDGKANLDYDAPAGSRWYGAYISEVNLGDTTVRWPVLATDSGATVYITNIEYSRVKQLDAKYIPVDGDTVKVNANGELEADVQGGPTVVQTTGTSTTDVMSQNATTSMVFADPATQYKIKIGAGTSSSEGSDGIEIGHNADATGISAVALGYAAKAKGVQSVAIGRGAYVDKDNAVAIGKSATVQHDGGIALGEGAVTTAVGQMAIGTTSTDYGYNSSNYRLLSGLYDGQSAHDAATKGQLDSIAIQNAGAPTTATVGTVGQLLEDTTNGKLYICTDATGGVYTWVEVGAGGGGGGVVELTSADYNWPTSNPNGVALWLLAPGTYHAAAGVGYYTAGAGGSVFTDGASFIVNELQSSSIGIVQIKANTMYYGVIDKATGAITTAYTRLTTPVVQTTGTSTTDVMSQNAVTSMVFADPGNRYRIRIGNNSSATQNNSVSIGDYISNYAVGGVVLGHGASASGQGSIALGAYTDANGQGVMSIAPTSSSYGYNNTRYRLLTGLYDPQSAHDAATKGYVDAQVGSISTALQTLISGTGATGA